MERSRRPASNAGILKTPRRGPHVKRWDGKNRTCADWDGLRRDSELFFQNGDILVHLYAKGNSRRGPTFRVPFETLQKFNCGPLFSICFAQLLPELQGSSPTGSGRPQDKYELYIPAPDHVPRDDAFSWHITTRNFFALVYRKPLVGTTMGKALVTLHDRMRMFRAKRANNHNDLLVYLEEMGYLNFAHHPDYALAVLYYAEQYQIFGLWADAFVHCVAMNDGLYLSPEFAAISPTT
ncbi:hypothetical protein BDY21DRAFT_278722, partial [Lineolata rhizophorae]